MAKKKTAAELREEARKLLKMADELERKERMERAEKVYRAVMEYLKQNPTAEVIPVSIMKEAQG